LIYIFSYLYLLECVIDSNMVVLQGKAVDVALPVSYLYLLHSHQPACLQAHVLFCSILRHAAVVRPSRNRNEMSAVLQTLENVTNGSTNGTGATSTAIPKYPCCVYRLFPYVAAQCENVNWYSYHNARCLVGPCPCLSVRQSRDLGVDDHAH
jgi:hypothetical protein